MAVHDVVAQREYYARTAAHYDSMHLAGGDEHALALGLFAGIARARGVTSVLDVGAGTGRALDILAAELPGVALTGIEPVEALRKVGHDRGIPEAMLIDGDALNIAFPDNAFDYVIETGVLHHVPDPRRAVLEMARVARHGVLISDSNNYGQGSPAGRWTKRAIRAAGLWKAFVWATTKGRMSKWSESDGVFYSYSVFDDLEALKAKFPRVVMANTLPSASVDLRFGAPHVVLLALRE